MTTFALLHGSGDGGWAWHLVQRALRERGHRAIAPDLPTDREEATWEDCVDAVVAELDEVSDRANGRLDRQVVVVGQSSAGFVVPLVADRIGAALQVFVTAMVPQPGETPGGWFEHVGWSEAVAEQARDDGGLTGAGDPSVSFYHDVPPDLAAEAMARERPTAQRLGGIPWPLPALPAIPARYVVATQDRFLPASVQRHVAAERLGIVQPDEIEAGHCVHLSRPDELTALLAGYV